MYLATNLDTFNNNEDEFAKDIPDADGKKVIQHHYKQNRNMHGKYVSHCGECEEKRL